MRKTELFLCLMIVGLIAGCSRFNHPDRPLQAPRGYPSEGWIKAAIVTGIVKLKEQPVAVPSQIEAFKDLTYKHVGDDSLQLDIYKLRDLKKPAPLIIFVHGGAWIKGKRKDYLLYLLDYAKKGYVTATVSYRLIEKEFFPAAVLDVNCAVQWLKVHAEQFGIDAAKIAMVGGSAGGHLSLMNAYMDEGILGPTCYDSIGTDVQAVVDLYGPVDLTTEYARTHESVTDFIGKSFSAAPDMYVAASPSTYISRDDPPTLIFQGSIDDLVPYSQSDSLHIWLDKVGVPNEYHLLKGWPHTMDLAEEVNEYCQFYMDAFFEKYLR